MQIRSNALIKRGSMFMQNGNEEDSRRDFAEAIIEDPKNSDIFHHRGQVWRCELLYSILLYVNIRYMLHKCSIWCFSLTF